MIVWRCWNKYVPKLNYSICIIMFEGEQGFRYNAPSSKGA